MIRKQALACLALATLAGAAAPQPARLDLGRLAPVATIDQRFQGYNIEMVEVTGGRFWAPYGSASGEMFRHHPPIDLANPRLIALARHLGPSLMRVSGSWANNTYVEAAGENLTEPPRGFRQVLRRDRWKDVVAFSQAVDAPIVTSFAASNGTRDSAGNWTSGQAQRLLDLTREAGGEIYAAEFFNEANMASSTAEMPKGYTAQNYTTDFRIFRDWARVNAPEMKLLGPSAVGDLGPLSQPRHNAQLGGHLRSEALLEGNPASLDGLSYHYYGTVSERCTGMAIGTAVKAEALSSEWLDRTVRHFDYYASLRDRFEPGKRVWNTETAQAACGGSPWASTFLDTFRYLAQLGLLAQKGAGGVMHNTLAASDYGLLDHDSFRPRPNYWAAVLWRRTMGTTVLASPRSPSPDLRLFAHCQPGQRGGVTVMALNTGAAAQPLNLGGPAIGWTMIGQPIDSRTVQINGRIPGVSKTGQLTGLGGLRHAGRVAVPGRSIAFYSLPGAGNPACN